MFQLCIPSWVAFTDDGAVLVGEHAKNQAAVNPEDAIFSFKCLLGKRCYLQREEEDCGESWRACRTRLWTETEGPASR